MKKLKAIWEVLTARKGWFVMVEHANHVTSRGHISKEVVDDLCHVTEKIYSEYYYADIDLEAKTPE